MNDAGCEMRDAGCRRSRAQVVQELAEARKNLASSEAVISRHPDKPKAREILTRSVARFQRTIEQLEAELKEGGR